MDPLSEIHARANYGDPFAQTLLGFLLELGLGFRQSHESARKWYRKASDQEFAPAQFSLHLMLVGDEPGTAIDLLQQSASAGYARAKATLAQHYWEGIIVQRDRDLAFKWMNEAAHQDFPPGLVGVALMYEEGLCVEKDAEAAKKYLLRAAEKGDARAAQMLGDRLLEDGDSKKVQEGLKWMRLAARKGDTFALMFLYEMYSFGLHGAAKDPELADLFKFWCESKISE